MAVTLLFMAGSVFAQVARPGQQRTLPGARAAGGEKSDKVEIKRMPPPNKTAMVRTPEFNYNVQNTMPKVSKKPREWRFSRSNTRPTPNGRMSCLSTTMS